MAMCASHEFSLGPPCCDKRNWIVSNLCLLPRLGTHFNDGRARFFFIRTARFEPALQCFSVHMISNETVKKAGVIA